MHTDGSNTAVRAPEALGPGAAHIGDDALAAGVPQPGEAAQRGVAGRGTPALDIVLAALHQLPSGSARAESAGAVVTVLDCGGGSGRAAVALAEAGAHVTVIDVSVDALATLTRRAAEAGVSDRVTARQGEVEALGRDLPGAMFDLVVAHGILASVDELTATFRAIAAAVRPGGVLSVLVANPVAGVLARAHSGELTDALRTLRSLVGSEDAVPPSGTSTGEASLGGAAEERALTPQRIEELCRAAGLTMLQVRGVGVFTDLVPAAALDAPGAREAFAQLEAEASVLAPFAAIATHVHLLARRA